MSIRDVLGVSASGDCLWCGQPIEPRLTGGSRRRFCSPRHRIAFHTAARRWAEYAVAAGILTVGDLRADPAAFTLRLSGIPHAAVP
jgi:hypothetical protein